MKYENKMNNYKELKEENDFLKSRVKLLEKAKCTCTTRFDECPVHGKNRPTPQELELPFCKEHNSYYFGISSTGPYCISCWYGHRDSIDASKSKSKKRNFPSEAYFDHDDIESDPYTDGAF